MSEFKFILDGKEVSAEHGQTIIQAAMANGVYIPRLCDKDGIEPWGSCRVCTVKANGRLSSACTQPVAPGMVVLNEDEELTALRVDHHNVREKLAQRTLSAVDTATASWSTMSLRRQAADAAENPGVVVALARETVQVRLTAVGTGEDRVALDDRGQDVHAAEVRYVVIPQHIAAFGIDSEQRQPCEHDELPALVGCRVGEEPGRRVDRVLDRHLPLDEVHDEERRTGDVGGAYGIAIHRTAAESWQRLRSTDGRGRHPPQRGFRTGPVRPPAAPASGP